ncbi:glutamine--tRNA ligase/YqeY domain fusion protein [Desulfobulbus alkaliphilus]|uniref:glutamine--tRNA ligase/YqeY domain fusion protein n=1 Tax=Desulfobulbus alkaliphilus TaxID=869814 RepID=UPI0019628B9F|nr:glutamine--tRNA ligase/YqeY domain fusion protein [Desulfobulbus alkaliphilus]MBM9536367.1 glutamine--tRNA ligase/YqeY domain fusion protein [Desulfobulbus alkaliphilus]
MTTEKEAVKKPLDFIRQIIADDLASGKHQGIVTRFPPEPNGFLHIGHAKSICLNFGVAREYNGVCHLRFDDTNPDKESTEYVEAIMRDVRWLGFDWEPHLYYASDYFEQLHDCAVRLIEMGKAYVCHLSADAIREYRGTLTEPGRESPYRNRSVEENLDLFARMRAGNIDEGVCVLRAKIDMASANIIMRDPVLYRILKTSHHRTGDKWCIYPMYDFTHCLSDMLEQVTHSLCTLEFENNRALYDWVLDTLQTPNHPRQIEFARLNINYTVTSKRKLLQLVEEGHVSGWDDPRMLTLSGLRRRGCPPAAIRHFCATIGIGKRESWIDMGVLENAVREELNQHAPRVFGVLEPLKIVLTNYPENLVEEVAAQNHPQEPALGDRQVPFCRELYIERSDFMEDAPKKFFRLSIGREVRLRYAYLITCHQVIKDAEGRIVELHCTYDPESKGGSSPDGRKVKGTIHWVSAPHAMRAEVRLYDRLFTVADPEMDKEKSFKEFLNPRSLTVLTDCALEPGLARATLEDRFQFERQGYFCLDSVESSPDKPVFNRIVTLRDSWAKISSTA